MYLQIVGNKDSNCHAFLTKLMNLLPFVSSIWQSSKVTCTISTMKLDKFINNAFALIARVMSATALFIN